MSLIQVGERNPTTWNPPNEHLKVTRCLIDIFPYRHMDVWAVDTRHGPDAEKYVFGIPYEREEGMAFYRLTGKGAEHEKRPDLGLETPVCPFHGTDCVLTKHFDFTGTQRYQHKCPDCFLTRYIDL